MELLRRAWTAVGHISTAHWIAGAIVGVATGGGSLFGGVPFAAAAIWTAIGLPAGIVGWEFLTDTRVGRSLRLGGGPDFHIDIPGPATVARASLSGPEGPFDLLFLIRIRVTNVGTPGAALDWTAWGEFPDGRRIGLERLTSIDMNFWGHAGGEIKRSDLIWERTASSLQKGETRAGYFLARLPIEEARRLGDQWELCVACRDYRKRASGMSFTVEWDGDSGLATIEEPTLPRVDLDLSKRRSTPGDWDTPK